MRKITLLLFLGMLTSLGWSQTYVDEDFSGGSLPSGWTNNDISGSGFLWYFNNPGGQTVNAPMSSPAAIFDSDYNGGGVENTALETPVFDASSATAVELRFDHYFRSGWGGAYDVEVYDGTSWVNVLSGSAADTANPASEIIDISTHVIGVTNAQVRFRWTGNFSWYWIVDNVYIGAPPACEQPTNLSTSNITDTSADLSWTEEGTATLWNVEIIAAGSTATGTPTATGVTNPYSATGLTSETDYEYYVQADCGSGSLSAWSGPYSFTTACSAIIAPFTENFDTTSTPNCWSESGDNSWEYSLSTPGYAASGLPDHTNGGGTYYALMDGSDNGDGDISTLTSPLIDISGLTTPALIFYAFSNNTDDAAINILDVEFYDGSSWNNVLNQTTLLGSSWSEIIIDLSSYTISGDIQVRFTVTGNANGGSTYYNDIIIDDVTIGEMPTCITPANVQLGVVADTTADFSWDAEATATTGYNWVVMADGDHPSTATPLFNGSVISGTTSVQVTGLSPTTDYDFYLQSDCGGGDLSDWSGPYSFTTECAVYTTPFLENFNGSAFVPDCWEEAGSGTPSTGPSSFGSSSWTDDDYLNDTNNTTAARVNLYAASKEEWLISPEIDLSTGIFNLEFLVGETDFANSGANEDGGMSTTDDEVQVLITTDGGTTWQNITTYSAANTPALTGQLESFSLAAYSGVVQIAFWASEGTVNDAADYDFFIDDVAIVVAPCEDPSNITVTNITETTADISWTENGSATEWEVIYGLPGFDPNTAGTTIVDNDGTIGVLLTGLTEGQDYDVYVRANCSTGFDSDWSLVGNFTTVCPAVSNVLVSNETETAADISWTENGSATEWEILYGVSGFNTSTAGTSVIDNDGTLGETLTGLTEGQDYDVYVRAMCSSVDSDWTVATTFTTVCPAVTGITFSNITENSADVSWTENGSATEWEILYGMTGFDPTTAGTSVLDNDGTLGETLTGLTEGQDYDVYVRAMCSSVDSDWTVAASFTTVCPAVTGITISNITTDSADVSWTENGSATEWEILYGPVNFDPNTAGTSVIDNDGTLGETLTGLTEGEDYDVYVRAICSSVDSAWVGPETFSTDELGVENHLLDGIKLYPNPVKNVLNFEFTNQIDNISVYNLLGERILDVRPKNLNTRISLESLQAGVYLVKAQKGSAMKVFKIVKE